MLRRTLVLWDVGGAFIEAEMKTKVVGDKSTSAKHLVYILARLGAIVNFYVLELLAEEHL